MTDRKEELRQSGLALSGWGGDGRGSGGGGIISAPPASFFTLLRYKSSSTIQPPTFIPTLQRHLNAKRYPTSTHRLNRPLLPYPSHHSHQIPRLRRSSGTRKRKRKKKKKPSVSTTIVFGSIRPNPIQVWKSDSEKKHPTRSSTKSSPASNLHITQSIRLEAKPLLVFARVSSSLSWRYCTMKRVSSSTNPSQLPIATRPIHL